VSSLDDRTNGSTKYYCRHNSCHKRKMDAPELRIVLLVEIVMSDSMHLEMGRSVRSDADRTRDVRVIIMNSTYRDSGIDGRLVLNTVHLNRENNNWLAVI